MKFINTLKTLAKRQDNKGLNALLMALATDFDTSSAQLQGCGRIDPSLNIYLFFSEGEAAMILLDPDGKEDELADEEPFNDQDPLWFTECGHRISPFFRLRAFTKGFVECMGINDHTEIEDYLCVLISNTHIINFDEMDDVYPELNGAVFHNIKDVNRLISVSNSGKAQELVDVFKDHCSCIDRLLNVLGHSEDVIDNPAPSDVPPPVSTNPWDFDTIEINDIVKEEEITDFVDPDDPDFKSTAEVFNPETGEKMTVKKDDDPPAVTIYSAMLDPKIFLDEMVGLHDLKKNLAEIVAYAKYTKKVRAAFPTLAHMPINLHSIIVGNPGTGKTTMCRIYGAMLHRAGILSRGHTVVASRGTFVGQHFGSEEKRVTQCLKLARGGCLFIDEAAQLFTHPHPHDPGSGVLQLMLQRLADEEYRDIAVVLALYANDKSLGRLYELNPGIKSRFPNVLTFPDYTLDELLEIAHRKAEVQALSFTSQAWKKFAAVLGEIYDRRDRNFANGREVVNLLQRCLIQHAVRCEKSGVTGPDLLRLTVRDIPDLPSPLIISRKLGF